MQIFAFCFPLLITFTITKQFAKTVKQFITANFTDKIV
ncbi:hypothetical protein M089_5258 [Bacteroides ovatus str. 3725 D9 iii]|nr:hypothetical protein M089_5258 [Bacteroides ovatus str. 3725 D9 iii]